MNDERPIEKLLRRYAKKRRNDAGAPVELHPATRRMLQGEVVRRFPQPASPGDREPTTFVQILIGWRARLVWAIPVFIVLGVGFWALVGTRERSGDTFHLAKSSPAPGSPVTTPAAVAESFKALEADKSALAFSDRNAPRETPEASGAPTTGSRDSFGISLADTAVRRKQGDDAVIGLTATPRIEPDLKLDAGRVAANELAHAPPLGETRGQSVVARPALDEPASIIGDEKTETRRLALSAPAKGGSPQDFDRVRTDNISERQGQRANVPASRPVALAPDASARYFKQDGRADGGREGGQTFSQTFANRAPVPANGKVAKSGGITPVLASFQVEQTGNQLRVIDGDGSTYLGEMESPTGAGVADAGEGKAGAKISFKSARSSIPQSAVAPLPGQQSAQNVFYRVSGTNRTLNQPVVFTWNFVELTNGLAAAQIKAPSRVGEVPPSNLPAQQFPYLLNNSRIAGRAQLGTAKEIEINAVPVTP